MANRERGLGETWENYKERMRIEKKIERLETRGTVIRKPELFNRAARRGQVPLTAEQKAFIEKRDAERAKKKENA